jgi:hypothetical protein
MICGTLLAVKMGIVAACKSMSLSMGTIPSFNNAYAADTKLKLTLLKNHLRCNICEECKTDLVVVVEKEKYNDNICEQLEQIKQKYFVK